MVQEQPATTQPRETVFDALIASLQGAAAYNRDDVVPPAAILWTDERREWESRVPRLRVVLPQFLVRGSHRTSSGRRIAARSLSAPKNRFHGSGKTIRV
jgi:hypothetical protein